MRLDKFLSHTSDLSRKDAKQAIKAGRVAINQHIATSGNQPVSTDDMVTLDSQPLAFPQARYFMLNKPKDYICATRDGEHPTVLDLLSEPAKQNLHIAGRLDKDTTGLVLITDDGQWSHRITAPAKKTFKRYHVSVAAPLTATAIASLEQGVLLNNEDHATLPARVSQVDDTHLLLSISEGRYHQVKRMLAAVGNRVTTLHREAIGPIELDSTLKPGQYRPLNDEEISEFL